MLKCVLVVGLLTVLIHSVHGHSYHTGDCPNIPTQSNFDLRKFLGLWYVIEKSKTLSSCIVYNYTKTPENEYFLEQFSLKPLGYQYRYVGQITIPDLINPSRMEVKFPLNIVGPANYSIVSTDYFSSAAIFTCQKLPVGYRNSITILSRDKSLDNNEIAKLKEKFSSASIDVSDLSPISQQDCPNIHDHQGIVINQETFSTDSVKQLFRKASQKIGEGYDYVAEGAKKAYKKITDSSEETGDVISSKTNPQSEWLP